jgi:hypothetical protein
MNTGTITLPDLKTNGRFRRSRQTSTSVGQTQAQQTLNHTHAITGVAGTTSSDGSHTHTASVTDPGHSHNFSNNPVVTGQQSNNASGGANFSIPTSVQTTTITSSSTGISVSNASSGAHTHTVSVTGVTDNPASGGTELRPYAVVVLTCVKT